MENFVDTQLKKFKLDEAHFSPPSHLYDIKSPAFYEGDVSIVKEKETKKSYYKVSIPNSNNIYKFIQRIKYFIYIANNKLPFGEIRGFTPKEDKNIFYFKYDPKKTLQSLLSEKNSSEDGEKILNDTSKSKTVLAVAAALEYCHSLGICCRFIHPESICYDEDNNPYIVNIGYSSSILNAPNSTFNTKVVNPSNNLFPGIDAYIAPELKKDNNAASFSTDVYAFGTFLNVLASLDTESTNKQIFDIIQKCHLKDSERCTSAEILKQIIEISGPLFSGCKMKAYKKYQSLVLENIYYNTEPSRNDNTHLFVYSARLLDQNADLELKDKANILQKLIISANNNYIPAIYRLSLFLNSNIDTSIYDIDQSPELYDPFNWMSKLVKYNIFRAPFLLGEMYDQRGLFKEGDAVYRKNSGNLLCKIKLSILDKENIIRQEMLKTTSRRNPDFILEVKILSEIRKFKNSEITIKEFKANMEKLMENNLNGKLRYLLAVLYRDGTISTNVLYGIDGIAPITKIDDIQYDEEAIIAKKKDEYLIYLKKASDLYYEPAVAEYALHLLEKNKIKDCRNLIDSFFSKYKCKYDYSKLRIQYAYAKLCEKIGENNDEDEMINKAIRIYKITADRGYVKSNVDYVRLYSVRKDANHALINYYQKRISTEYQY